MNNSGAGKGRGDTVPCQLLDILLQSRQLLALFDCRPVTVNFAHHAKLS